MLILRSKFLFYIYNTNLKIAVIFFLSKVAFIDTNLTFMGIINLTKPCQRFYLYLIQNINTDQDCFPFKSVYYVSACLLLVGMFLFTFFLQKFKTKMKSGCFDTLPRLDLLSIYTYLCTIFTADIILLLKYNVKN